MATKGPVTPVPVFAIQNAADVLALRGTLRKVGFKKEDPKFTENVNNGVAQQIKALPVQTAPVAAPVAPIVPAIPKAPVAPIVPAIPKAPVAKAPVKQPMNPLNKGRALPPTPAPKAPVRKESLETPPPPPPRDIEVEVSPVAPRMAPTPPPRSPIAAHIEVAPVAPTMAPPPPPPPPAPVAKAAVKVDGAAIQAPALLFSGNDLAAQGQRLKKAQTKEAAPAKTGTVVATTVAAPAAAVAPAAVDATRNRANTAPQFGMNVAGMDMNAARQGLKKRGGSLK